MWVCVSEGVCLYEMAGANVTDTHTHTRTHARTHARAHTQRERERARERGKRTHKALIALSLSLPRLFGPCQVADRPCTGDITYFELEILELGQVRHAFATLISLSFDLLTSFHPTVFPFSLWHYLSALSLSLSLTRRSFLTHLILISLSLSRSRFLVSLSLPLHP